MKYLSIFFLCTLTSTVVLAQDYNTIAAKIIDAETNQPVEFVNIGFIDKGIGTVSGRDGTFKLTYEIDTITYDDILQISSIGYETKVIYLYELKDLYSYDVAIKLTPQLNGLDEVLLTTEKREFEKLGSSYYARSQQGYWRNIDGLGGEIASKITVNHRNTLLESLSFNIEENVSDSLLVRVKVYDYYRGVPGKELVTQNIFHTIKKKKGVETIPLKDYNIVVDENIIVSLELVEVYGDAIYFVLSASPYGGLSYTKKASQGDWRIYNDVGISYNLISSYTKRATGIEEVSRKKPEYLQVYWDTSLAMKNRNIKDELKVLSKYLKRLEAASVEVVTFNSTETISKTFEYSNRNVKDIISHLASSYYIGTTDYSQILKEADKNLEAVLLFTNGQSMLTALQPGIDTPIFTINSLATADHQVLQNISRYSGGHYINLNKANISEGLDFLTNEVEDSNVYTSLDTEDKRGFVYGVVYDDNGPIANATVSIKNTFVQATTGPNGRYVIDATKGDVLNIKAFGSYSKDTIVSRTKKLHIPLEENTVALEEVLLEKKVDRAAEIVETPFGKKKRGSVGFSMFTTFTDKDISPAHFFWDDIFKRLPGVIYVKKKPALRKTMRSHADVSIISFPAIIVDDMVYDQLTDQFPPPMDLQMVKSVTVLSTINATQRYGRLASYGAIVVKLKKPEDYDRNITEKKNVKKVPKRLKYTETISTFEIAKSIAKKSNQLIALEKSESLVAAKQLFATHLQNDEAPSISYLLEATDYFYEKDSDFGIGVASTIAHFAKNNPKALKTLAYEFEKLEDYKKALVVYNQLLELNNRDVQSYLDLARSLKQTGAYKAAGELYTNMLFNSIPDVDFTLAADMITSEIQQLLSLHKSKINFKDLPQEMLTESFTPDIRMVFDWNDPTTDFELQFVDPNNKFFTYAHTIFENRKEVSADIEAGIASKEFILDKPEPGKWLININPIGDTNAKNPTVIKYTLYRNYGTVNETKTIKTIDLSKYETKITLDSFVY